MPYGPATRNRGGNALAWRSGPERRSGARHPWPHDTIRTSRASQGHQVGQAARAGLAVRLCDFVADFLPPIAGIAHPQPVARRRDVAPVQIRDDVGMVAADPDEAIAIAAVQGERKSVV